MEKLEELRGYTQEEYWDTFFNGKRNLNDFTCKDTVFAIPDYRVPTLHRKLEPYFKKAKQLGIPYTFEELGKVELKDDENKKQHCIIVRLDFSIQLNGWTFVAAIDHTPNGNIIRNASKMELPEKFRTTKGYCEHCNTLRNRKSTYIVYSEKEGFKQVGKSCLFLYTGLDLNKIAYALDIMNFVHDYINEEDCDCEGYWGFKSTTEDAREVLALSWKIVSLFGYVKKGTENSTINRYCTACEYLDGSMKRYQERKYQEYSKFVEENNIKFFTNEDYEMADKIIECIMQQNSSSEYMHNLQVIFANLQEGDNTDYQGKTYHYKHCYMDKKYRNIVISAVQTYLKIMNLVKEREAKLENAKKVSQHIGNLKDKISTNITEASIITSWENSYGSRGYYTVTTYKYRLVSEDGNIFIWRTNKFIDTKKAFNISGTVKEHSEYKGVKQTELTRCKVTYLEEVGEVA